MSQFVVYAVDKAGKNIKVLIDADSVKTARGKARAQGLTPLDVKSGGGTESGNKIMSRLNANIGGGGGRIKVDELANMTRQLASLIKSNVPVVESLNALVEQIDNRELARVLGVVRDRVREGQSLGDAMSRFPTTFDRVYVNMVRAGESSGRLDTVLLRLADFAESRVKLKNKVMGAVLYPVILVCVSFLVLGVIFMVVVPQITRIFEDMNQVLPLPTRILIGMSDFARGYFLPIAGGLIVLTFMIFRYVATPSGRKAKDRFLLQAPIVGKIFRNIAVARFSRTLGTLLKSGVPMLGALEITKNVLDNALFEDAMDFCKVQVSEGKSLSRTLKVTQEFPPIVIHMVGVGEKTGDLEGMLGNVAENYELQVDTSLGALTTVLNPIMIIGMAGIVFFIVMAVLMPIFEMNQFA